MVWNHASGPVEGEDLLFIDCAGAVWEVALAHHLWWIVNFERLVTDVFADTSWEGPNHRQTFRRELINFGVTYELTGKYTIYGQPHMFDRMMHHFQGLQ